MLRRQMPNDKTTFLHTSLYPAKTFAKNMAARGKVFGKGVWQLDIETILVRLIVSLDHLSFSHRS